MWRFQFFTLTIRSRGMVRLLFAQSLHICQLQNTLEDRWLSRAYLLMLLAHLLAVTLMRRGGCRARIWGRFDSQHYEIPLSCARYRCYFLVLLLKLLALVLWEYLPNSTSASSCDYHSILIKNWWSIILVLNSSPVNSLSQLLLNSWLRYYHKMFPV